MLHKHFFPKEPEADLSDVEMHRYPPPVEPLPQVTVEEVQAAMGRQRRFSAPGSDSIFNGFLQAMGEPFARAMAGLTQACWDTGYYPK